MKKSSRRIIASDKFQAGQLRSGDPYELSDGRVILCMPTGGCGSRANLLGGQVFDTDPDVESAGVDTSFTPSPGILRTPDVAAVSNVADEPGWVQDTPPLAVKYADSGQDEKELTDKIVRVDAIIMYDYTCLYLILHILNSISNFVFSGEQPCK